MKKPAIPGTQGVADQNIVRILQPIKENIESLTGVRGGKIATLPTDASLGQVILKINEIIGRINYD